MASSRRPLSVSQADAKDKHTSRRELSDILLTNGSSALGAPIVLPCTTASNDVWRPASSTDVVSIFLTILASMILVLAFQYYYLEKLPPPRVCSTATHGEIGCHYDPLFFESNARRYLQVLSDDIGVRLAGSYNNEVRAVQMLLKTVESVESRQKTLKDSHPDERYPDIEVMVQSASGSYCLRDVLMTDGIITHYSNISNIFIRVKHPLRDSNKKRATLLLSSHYDSSVGSPGASDDGASISVMLEIIRVLSITPVRASFDNGLFHDVLFIFNGQEEFFLQASHGALSHEWMKSVSAFINLEGAGNGHKELLFQTSNPLLAEAYIQVTPYSHGNVVGQNLFSTNIIPSDTDFRVYRDEGGMPGLDMAFYRGGYTYHTKMDRSDAVDEGSLQHMGENVLALVRHFSAHGFPLDQITLSTTTKSWFEGEYTYYNFINMNISYHGNTATILALCVNFLSLITIWCVLPPSHNLLLSFIGGVGRILLIWARGLASAIVVAMVLGLSGFTFSWYSRPWLSLMIYGAPTLFGAWWQCTSLLQSGRGFVIAPLHSKTSDSDCKSMSCVTSLTIDVLCFFSFILFISAMFGVGSGYLALWITFGVIVSIFLKTFPINYRILTGTHVWWCAFFLDLVVSCLILSPVTLNSYLFFVPVMGRAGLGGYCELVIAFLTSSMLLLHLTPVLGLLTVIPVIVTKNTRDGPSQHRVSMQPTWSKSAWLCLLFIFIIALAFVFLTPSHTAAFPARCILQHTISDISPPRPALRMIVDKDIEASEALALAAKQGPPPLDPSRDITSRVHLIRLDGTSPNVMAKTTMPALLGGAWVDGSLSARVVSTSQVTSNFYPLEHVFTDSLELIFDDIDSRQNNHNSKSSLLTALQNYKRNNKNVGIVTTDASIIRNAAWLVVTGESVDVLAKTRTIRAAILSTLTGYTTVDIHDTDRIASWSLTCSPDNSPEFPLKSHDANLKRYIIRHVGGLERNWHLTLTIKEESERTPLHVSLSTTIFVAGLSSAGNDDPLMAVPSEELVLVSQYLPSAFQPISWMASLSSWEL